MSEEREKKKIQRAITSLDVRGFRSIEETSLSFEKMNILVGANGSGKSNLLEVFRMLSFLAHQRLEYYGSLQSSLPTLFFGGFPKTDEIRILLKFSSTVGSNEYRLSLVGSRTQDLKLFIKEEAVSFQSKMPNASKTTQSFDSMKKETNLVGKGKTGIPWVAADFLKKIVFYRPDLGAGSKLKGFAKIDDNESFASDASNLAPFLYRLQEKDSHRFTKIKRNLQRVAPFVEDIILRPSPLNEGYIKLEWKPKRMEGYWDAYSLSEGTLRFLALITLLLQPDPPDVILLDEPEVGLHPFAVHLLVNLMMSHPSQFVLATQSADLLDYFQPSHLIITERKGEASVFSRLESEPLAIWLEEYKTGELWEKNILGGNIS